MNLRDRLEQLLPDLLPTRESEAIKGRELIARVRAVLGETYSDHSLRSQFSFMALDPGSCLARVPNGQGYYRRSEGTLPSLHRLFENEGDADREGSDPFHKLLALAVRLYDTAGMGVFLYPIEPEESWQHPDLVAVQWPLGCIDAAGRYTMDRDADPTVSYRAVCVSVADSVDDCRRALFRTVSCGLWAQESELLLLPGELDTSTAAEALQQLAPLYGAGVWLLEADGDTLAALPRADELFRADAPSACALLAGLPRHRLAIPHRLTEPRFAGNDTALEAFRQWAGGCVQRGCVEPFEQRVAAN